MKELNNGAVSNILFDQDCLTTKIHVFATKSRCIKTKSKTPPLGLGSRKETQNRAMSGSDAEVSDAGASSQLAEMYSKIQYLIPTAIKRKVVASPCLRQTTPKRLTLFIYST